MKRFSMIIGLIFFICVFANGCDKGEQPPEPNVKDAAKKEMEEPAKALEEVKEEAEEVLEETAQDVKEATETVKKETAEAMEEADAIIMLFDGRDGENPADSDLVQRLRQSRKPVFYVVNKIDGPRHEGLLSDFSRLGVDPLYPLSAEHRYGMDDLMDALTEVLPQAPAESSGDRVRLRSAAVPSASTGPESGSAASR